MNFNSITFKLLAFIVGIFIVTTAGVLILADIQLKQILDKSQEAVYMERVDTIAAILNRSHERLQKTGLVEAYIDEFKQSALDFLRKNYYKESSLSIYPFIINAEGAVVLHPVLPVGDLSVKDTPLAAKMLSTDKGALNYAYQRQKKCYIYKRFTPWNWVVGYAVPLDIKYADARKFRNMLVLIMGGITAAVILVLSLFVTKFTRPIIKLSNASKQIAGGEHECQINVDAGDEIGVLARNFEMMRKAVRNQIAELNTEISERKKAEKESRRLRSYLCNIIDSMPSMLMGVTPGGIITQWNSEAVRASGLSAEEVLGKPFCKVVPWLSIEMKQVHQAIETRQEVCNAKRSRQTDGGIIYEDVTIYPLTGNDVEGAVIRIDDVTGRVRMEEMMVQSEKMLSVGGLAAGMAHEINNPLAGIMQTAGVMANRLGRSLELPANRRAAEEAGTTIEAVDRFMKARSIPRMLDTITVSGRRVAEIVNNMLSFARKGDVGVSTCKLENLLDKTLELAATDYDLKKKYDFKRISITREYAEDLPPVPCKSDKIQQVLLNIFSNGAQAMQGAGTENPRLIVRTYFAEDRHMVCIEIEDNGPGMDKAASRRVFEPFFTTKPVGVGTGLGLSVSFFIITENHQGEMAVESRPGCGTKFIVRLPVDGREKESYGER